MQTVTAFSCWTPCQKTFAWKVSCPSNLCKNNPTMFHVTKRRNSVFSTSFLGLPVTFYPCQWRQASREEHQRHVGSVSMEVRIDVGESEPIDSAISRFRREVSKSGHIFELKRRQEFEPNSVKRQRKRKQAVRKAKLALFRGKRMENFRKDIL